MYPTPANVAVFMFPTAVFTPNPPSQPNSTQPEWCNSALNPKNRVCALDPLIRPSWDIDGCDQAGTRFYAIPKFARGRPPLRIDVYIPEFEETPPSLRDVLWPNPSMFHKRSDVESLSISRHISRALEYWSESEADFQQQYNSMPYGSHIIVDNIAADVKEMRIRFKATYALEKQWLTLKTLQNMWNFAQDIWPEVLEFDRLQLRKQLHDTISLVSISGRENSEFVFKSLTHDLKYMYHEMKLLLTLEPHSNIMRRPLYIVVKRCSFGGKLGVCGMILEHHSLGTLGSLIESHGQSTYPSLHDSIAWAKQITSAMIHIQEKGPGFYSNLKPDNIVMASEDGTRTPKIVLIDLEQRLGSPIWSPPEVHYVDYLIQLATKSPDHTVRNKYTELLQSRGISTTNLTASARYTNPEYGYCEPWPRLTRQEQEAAHAFMLGKLLWCIFENAIFLNTYIDIDTDRTVTGGIRFPDFRRTPQELRDIILRCTAIPQQASGQLTSLTLADGKIYPLGLEVEDSSEALDIVQIVIRKWWRLEIARAEQLLISRVDGNTKQDLHEHLKIRPTLKEILGILTSL